MRRALLVWASLVTAMIMCATGAGEAAVAAVPATVIDGMRVGHLPDGIGTPSDFAYEFDDVGFVSRDWESRTSDGGYRVDLSIDVLRGQHLATPRSTHDWVIAYEERPSDEVTYRPTTVHGRPAWRAADEIFWQVRPGVAVIVRLDTSRWQRAELNRVAVGVRGR